MAVDSPPGHTRRRIWADRMCPAPMSRPSCLACGTVLGLQFRKTDGTVCLGAANDTGVCCTYWMIAGTGVTCAVLALLAGLDDQSLLSFKYVGSRNGRGRAGIEGAREVANCIQSRAQPLGRVSQRRLARQIGLHSARHSLSDFWPS